MSRRELLRTAALGGGGLLSAYLVACKSAGTPSRATPKPTPVPTSGVRATLTSGPMTWTQVTPASRPPGRHDHSLATDGQRLYMFGGRAGGTTMADLWTYDVATRTWSEVSTFGPQARFGHNGVWDANRNMLVVFGGQDGSTFFNDIWEFDPARTLWTQVTFADAAPDPRYGAAAALDGAGHLFITHGFTFQGRFDDTWQYDLAGHTWTNVTPTGQKPVKRCLIRGEWDILKQRMFIFGGQTDGTPFLDDLWGYSPEFSGWQQLAREPHPAARTFYSLVYHADGAQAILFGGNTEQGPVNDLWAFHSGGETWTQIPVDGVPPDSRYGHDAALVTQAPSLLIFGGTDGTRELDDLWQLSPSG